MFIFYNLSAAAIPIPATLRTNQMSLDNRFKVMDDTDEDDNDDDDDRRVDNPSSTDKERSAERYELFPLININFYLEICINNCQ